MPYAVISALHAFCKCAHFFSVACGGEAGSIADHSKGMNVIACNRLLGYATQGRASLQWERNLHSSWRTVWGIVIGESWQTWVWGVPPLLDGVMETGYPSVHRVCKPWSKGRLPSYPFQSTVRRTEIMYLGKALHRYCFVHNYTAHLVCFPGTWLLASSIKKLSCFPRIILEWQLINCFQSIEWNIYLFVYYICLPICLCSFATKFLGLDKVCRWRKWRVFVIVGL